MVLAVGAWVTRWVTPLQICIRPRLSVTILLTSPTPSISLTLLATLVCLASPLACDTIKLINQCLTLRVIVPQLSIVGLHPIPTRLLPQLETSHPILLLLRARFLVELTVQLLT
jgi:hypothetical protein